ncbi:MAG: ribonuclease J [bacterium]|nr:ribonuclease J [bacterium]
MSHDLRIIPLGGLGEIGMNMMLFEVGDEVMIVDCGLMFPEPHMPGIDIVIPDFQYLIQNRKKIRGLVVTHGHEDHIGAIPFFLRHFNPPIYGTPLTLGLVEAKFKEHDLEKVNLVETRHGESVKIGPFSVEFIRVCHSIPDASALAIGTPKGLLVHSGDFKFDDTPTDCKTPDYEALKKYGDRGVLALMSDSTNVEVKGFTESEGKLAPFFKELCDHKGGKIIIALFSSNINRVQQIVSAAEEKRKKIILVGRSLVSNIRVAREKGYLKVASDTLVDIKKMEKYSPDELVVITTGSQGEPMSGLSRIATKTHKYILVEKGDKVVLSSKAIPGNEKLVYNIINLLTKAGARVLYEKIAPVHVTGHAHEEELKKMISLVRPEFFIPVHGEYRHLARHIELATEMGLLKEKTILAQDGDVIKLTKEKVEIACRVPTGRVFVDGKGVGDVEEIVLRDRVNLSKDGTVILVASINRSSGEIISGIDIFSKGLISEDEEAELLTEAKMAVQKHLDQLSLEIKTDWTEAEAEIRKSLKRFFKKSLDRWPVIIPVVIEL